MWFCFNDAFVSVVAQHDNPDMLLVRARSYIHLTKLFDARRIKVDRTRDYHFRVLCTKQDWANIVTSRIMNIRYTNFKDSVKEKKLHRLYEEFWYLHMIYQNGKDWWRRTWNKKPQKPQPEKGEKK